MAYPIRSLPTRAAEHALTGACRKLEAGAGPRNSSRAAVNAVGFSSAILVEGPIEIEAGAHRSRRGISRGIEIEIGLADRRRIEATDIIKGLQILSLAPGDEHLRQIAHGMEREMPDSRIGAQAIEHGGSRDRRIHHHQVGDLVPMRLGIGIGHHQPDIVTDQRDGAVDLEVLVQQPWCACRSRRVAARSARRRDSRERRRGSRPRPAAG